MGYTHYWAFKTPKRGEIRKQNERYKTAINDCQRVIKAISAVDGGLSGYTAHAPLGAYDGVKINGTKDASCEDFMLRATLKEALQSGDFCKTNRYHYDTAVVACLVILWNAGLIDVSSDGDSHDWALGHRTACRVLGADLELPTSLRAGRLKVVS